jgi:hypothetical protein
MLRSIAIIEHAISQHIVIYKNCGLERWILFFKKPESSVPSRLDDEGGDDPAASLLGECCRLYPPIIADKESGCDLGGFDT